MSDPIISQLSYPTLQEWWNSKMEAGREILSSNNITSLWWGYRAFGDGVVQDLDELNQTLTVILSTPQGSDIHRPTFSTGIWNHVDKPVNRVTPFLVRDSFQAVEDWEPRLELTELDISIDGAAGRVNMEAQWEIIDSDLQGQAEVILNLGQEL